MVMVDHGSTKGIITIPCNKMIDAEQTAQKFIGNIFRRFRLPHSFLSDRGPQFNSQVFKEMAQLLGFKTLRSTTYHLQTDGEMERVNQELKIYLRVFCSNHPEMWSSLNSVMEFCHNQCLHFTIKTSQFNLIMGFKPKDIPLAFKRTNMLTVENRLKTLKEARNKASATHELARKKVAKRTT